MTGFIISLPNRVCTILRYWLSKFLTQNGSKNAIFLLLSNKLKKKKRFHSIYLHWSDNIFFQLLLEGELSQMASVHLRTAVSIRVCCQLDVTTYSKLRQQQLCRYVLYAIDSTSMYEHEAGGWCFGLSKQHIRTYAKIGVRMFFLIFSKQVVQVELPLKTLMPHKNMRFHPILEF